KLFGWLKTKWLQFRMSFQGNKTKTVYFLPYLPLEKEIRIGNMLFWPFHALNQKYIKNTAVLSQLEKIFGCYVDRNGDVTQSITIASIRKPQFRQFSGNELDNLEEFTPGEDMLSMTYRFRRKAFGGYVQNLGPYEPEQVKFVQPESVLLAAATEVNPGMLAGLE